MVSSKRNMAARKGTIHNAVQASLLDAAVRSSAGAASTEGGIGAEPTEEAALCRHVSREAGLLSLQISAMPCDDVWRLRSLSLRKRREAALSCFVRVGSAPAISSRADACAASR